MSYKPGQELVDFASRFLENRGAVLEINPSGFEALLPETLAELLETGDHIQVAGGSTADGKALYSIGFGSPLLEKMVSAACSKIPLLSCGLEFEYLKSQGFEKLIRKQLNFNGSAGKIESSAIIKTDYLFMTCRYVAQSDEQKQGLLRLVFNHETGALIPGMADMLSNVVRHFNKPPKPVLNDAMLERIMEGIKKESEKILGQVMLSFKESMTRRFRRDVGNLEEYYDALKKEMEKSLERPGQSDDLIRDRKEKIALIPEELTRKKDDLFKKYSIRVNIEPCAAMFIKTPAVRILYRAMIGRKKKNLSLTYNPVTKAIDPLVCQGCGTSITSIYFCSHLHLLCHECNTKCPVC